MIVRYRNGADMFCKFLTAFSPEENIYAFEFIVSKAFFSYFYGYARVVRVCSCISVLKNGF